jgi:hypothetical protein
MFKARTNANRGLLVKTRSCLVPSELTFGLIKPSIDELQRIIPALDCDIKENPFSPT